MEKRLPLMLQIVIKKNKYIQKASLNGKTLDGPWFTHEDLVNGGTLELEMGSHPNKAWGASEENVPQIFKTSN